jgi:ankyrin repeat protein
MSDATAEFFEAVTQGQTDQVESLLNSNPALVNSEHEQATPLHIAAIENQREVVDLLLARGANLNARDHEFNMTPIGWANEKGHTEMVKYLYARGAEIDLYAATAFGLIDRVKECLTTDPAKINEANHYGTPIHEASLWGHVEIIRLLLEKGADDTLKNTHGETPLQIAENQVASGCRATPIVIDSRRTEIAAGCRAVVDLLKARG